MSIRVVPEVEPVGGFGGRRRPAVSLVARGSAFGAFPAKLVIGDEPAWESR